MAAAVGVRGRCELPPCSGPGWLLSLSALLSVAARGAFATTHWVVTEDGKIQQQVVVRASLSTRTRSQLRPEEFLGLAPGFWLRAALPQAFLPMVPARRPGRPRCTDPAPTPPHLCLALAWVSCKFSAFHPCGCSPRAKSRPAVGCRAPGTFLVLVL